MLSAGKTAEYVPTTEVFRYSRYPCSLENENVKANVYRNQSEVVERNELQSSWGVGSIRVACARPLFRDGIGSLALSVVRNPRRPCGEAS